MTSSSHSSAGGGVEEGRTLRLLLTVLLNSTWTFAIFVFPDDLCANR